MKKEALLGFPTNNFTLLFKLVTNRKIRVKGVTDGKETNYVMKGQLLEGKLRIYGKYAGEPINIVGSSSGNNKDNTRIDFKSISGIPVDECIENNNITGNIDGKKIQQKVKASIDDIYHPTYSSVGSIAGAQFNVTLNTSNHLFNNPKKKGQIKIDLQMDDDDENEKKETIKVKGSYGDVEVNEIILCGSPSLKGLHKKLSSNVYDRRGLFGKALSPEHRKSFMLSLIGTLSFMTGPAVALTLAPILGAAMFVGGAIVSIIGKELARN